MANISKINVKGTTYELKDISSRSDLATMLDNGEAKKLGTAAFADTATTVVDGGSALPTQDAVYEAIKSQIAGLEGAMHFRGIITKLEGESDLDALARAITDPKSGDVAIVGVKEYVYAGLQWSELGDETIYLTKATAAQTYVPQTTTIAGIDLQDNISTDEMKTALSLKALAYKDSAEGSLSTVDSADDISFGKAGEYTVTGTAVSVPQTYTALDVTPAGSVTISANQAASATYEKTTSATIAASTAGEGQIANYIPAGTITLPSFTSTLSPTKEAVATVTDSGTGYSITAGSVTKGADTTDTFAKIGITASMGEGEDAETLIFADATTASAVTESATPNYTAPVLSGALPTFGSKDVMTAATVSTAKDGNATFTGTGAILAASLGYTTETATVTQPTYTASFSGTEKTVTPTAASSASAAPSDATVTIASDTKSITLNKTSKVITVQ